MIKINNFIILLVNFIYKQLAHQKYYLISWAPVLQSVGIIVYFSLNQEPEVFVLVTILSIELLIFIILLLMKKLSISLLAVFIILLGFVSAFLKTYLIGNHTVKHQVYVENIIAKVVKIAYKPSYKQLLLCEVENIKYKINCIRVAVRTKIDSQVDLGDKVTLSAILYPPPLPISKFSYDFSKIAYFQKISAVGFATSKVLLYQKQSKSNFFDIIELLRMKIFNNLHSNMKDTQANVASALLIGKKEGISQEVMDNIRISGIAHLFAISGLHLSFVSFLIFILIRNLLALSERLTLKYNIKKVAAIVSIVVSFLYLLITGMPISAQRAFVMVMLVFVSILIDRDHNVMRSLVIAASVILLVTPESLFSPSFQMSFAAVLGLISSYDLVCRVSINSHFFEYLRVLKYFLSIIFSSIVASLATAAYVIYNFNYFSLSGIFTNLLAIPIATLIIIPAGMVYIFLIPVHLEFIVSPIIQRSIDVILYLSREVSKIDSSTIYIHSFPDYSVTIFTFGFLLLCLWNGKLKFFGLLFIFVGLISGLVYCTPDILVEANNAAVKEKDNKLYSITNSKRNFTVTTWAKQNGQQNIDLYKDYLNADRRLVCMEKVNCLYKKFDKSILISDNINYTSRNCNFVNLVVQFGNFSYPNSCKTPYVSYKQLEKKGTHSIWVTKDGVKIHKIYKNRPWYNR